MTDQETATQTGQDPVRQLTLRLVGLALLLLIYVLFAQRLTPMTTGGSVQAFLIRLAPEVAGRVAEVTVSDNQVVKQGEPLFMLDPEPYQIALTQAEAKVANVGQSLGADTAAVQSAQAKVLQATAAYNNAREQSARVMELVRRGVMSQSQKDQAVAALQQADATLAATKAELERAKQNLGPSGEANPRLQEAMSALSRARLDLMRTTVTAPNDGVITNVQLAAGQYAAVGTPAMTFIDTHAVWINAMLPENSLEYLKSGTEAEVVFDVLPGRVFQARVESLGWGSALSGTTDPTTGLLTSNGPDNQDRAFPVNLVLTEPLPHGLRYGSRASVILYTHKVRPLDWIAAGWIRVYSWLSYIL